MCQSWIRDSGRDTNYNFLGGREKRKKKKRIKRPIDDKLNHHQRHVSYQQETKHGSASNDMMKGYFWTMGGVAHDTHSVLAPPTCLIVSYICLNFFYSNIKSPTILYVNNEKTFGKSPLRSFFYFLTSNGISVISLYFWFIFFIFVQIQNCSHLTWK
jgi:hypothetical protein